MTLPEERTATFTGSDKLPIFYRFMPAPNEKARIVIAHGLGEHSGRYGYLMERLAEKGFSVWAPDHRGHGQSGGKRGHIRSFDQYILDLRQMLAIAEKDKPETRKCFLLGHSMGGLMALNYALKHPDKIDGLIASSPGLAPGYPIPKLKAIAGRIMSVIWPTLAFDNELDSNLLSHDPAVVSDYNHDPLVHRQVTARWFTEFLKVMTETMESAPKLRTPVFLQVAGDDRLAAPEAARRFFEGIALEDKSISTYHGLYHEIYNEAAENRKKVVKDLETWLHDHA